METQAIQKWYTKPQVIAIGATAAYLLLNKKTRKPVATAAGAGLVLMGINTSKEGSDRLSQGFGRAFMVAGAALLWYGLRKKK